MFEFDGLYQPEVSGGNLVWNIISIVVAIIGGITLYFIFTNKEFSGKFKGNVKKLVEYLTFERNILLPILKVTYLIFAIYITLSSFGMLTFSFLAFLLCLVLGNLLLRVGYEMSLLVIGLAHDVKEIKKDIKKSGKE